MPDDKTDQAEADLRLQKLTDDLRKATDSLRAFQQNQENPAFVISTQLLDNPGHVNSNANSPKRASPSAASAPSPNAASPTRNATGDRPSGDCPSVTACQKGCPNVIPYLGDPAFQAELACLDSCAQALYACLANQARGRYSLQQLLEGVSIDQMGLLMPW